jgi:hypothetical protein
MSDAENPRAKKLTDRDAMEIIRRYELGLHTTSLAKEFGVHRSTIHGIGTRKSWKHLTPAKVRDATMRDEIYDQLKAIGCQRISVAEKFGLNLYYARFRWQGLNYTLYGTSAVDLAKRVAVWCEKRAEAAA